jgi:hypothetical protein
LRPACSACAAARAGCRSADTLLARARSVLAEVGHATEHHERILSSAVDKADGLSDADLKRLKYVVTNLKGGVLELGAHARFVEGARARTQAAATPARASDARPSLTPAADTCE